MYRLGCSSFVLIYAEDGIKLVEKESLRIDEVVTRFNAFLDHFNQGLEEHKVEPHQLWRQLHDLEKELRLANDESLLKVLANPSASVKPAVSCIKACCAR